MYENLSYYTDDYGNTNEAYALDLISWWKMQRYILAERFQLTPAYFDEAGDAPNFPEGIDIRAHEIQDMISVASAISLYRKYQTK